MKLGRKVIATDLNPLSSFVMDTMTRRFDEKAFCGAVDRISSAISGDAVYKKHYTRVHEGIECTVYNYIWENGAVSKVRMKDSGKKQYSISASEDDVRNVAEMSGIEIPYWYPQDEFPENPSINLTS